MTAPPLRPRSRVRGFTLVETMLALGLTAAVMAMSLPFLHTARRLWERGERGREASRALEGAAGWICRDLRQAGFHVPGPALVAAEEGRLAYTLSRDGAEPLGARAQNRRLVTVSVEDGDLKYRVQEPQPPPGAGWERGSTQVIAPGVASLRCSGLAGDGAEAPSPDEAVLVACVLEASGGGRRRFAVRIRAPRGGPP